MFLLGATLALGFALSAYIVAQALVKISQKNHIFVKGSALQLVASDYGIWSGSFSTSNAVLADAYAKLAADQKQVEEFLKKAGFTAQEIAFESIEMQENMQRDAKGNLTRVVQDYSLTQRVVVSSEKVELLDKLSRDFTSLIQSGVLSRSNGANFIIRDLDKYKMQLLSEATKNGRDRAETLAANSGGQVGGLISASQGVFQITAPASGAMSSYGVYDKTTIMKEIKAVVTLEFRVQ